ASRHNIELKSTDACPNLRIESPAWARKREQHPLSAPIEIGSYRLFQRSANAANLSSMVGPGLVTAGEGFFDCGAEPCAGFEPCVFIDKAIRLVFASALSTRTRTI